MPLRFLFGVWNLSNLVTAAYGIHAPMTIDHNGGLELPCSDELWHACTDAEWNQVRVAELSNRNAGAYALTVKEACALLLDEDGQYSAMIAGGKVASQGWSTFTLVSIIHILTTGIWHSNTSEPLGVSRLAGSRLAATVRRCHELIRAHHDEQTTGGRRRPHALWQIADAADVLRICYGRIVPAIARVDRESLLRAEPEVVSAAMRLHVAVPWERSKDATMAVAVAYQGLCIPLRYGSQYFRKAGALSGSLEQLIAGWENGQSPALPPNLPYPMYTSPLMLDGYSDMDCF